MKATQPGPFVKVPLTQGKAALISPEDAERCQDYKWQAVRFTQNGRQIYRARAWFKGKATNVFLHRFLMDSPKGAHVDHKNGNPLDCRRGNIREATPNQNQWNRRKRSAHPYRGIRPHRRKWRAYIKAHGERHFLGSFETPIEAAQAYDEAARRLHGEFACVNFPTDGERRAW